MGVPKFNELLNEDLRKDPIQKNESQNLTGEISSLVQDLNSGGNAEEGLSVKLIPRSKIVFHHKNDYSQSDIEALAKSILELGLLNIPSGYYEEETDKYVVENGERRTRAIDLLISTYQDRDNKASDKDYQLYEKNIKKYVKGYPFNVTIKVGIDQGLSRLDEIDSELRVIDANEEVRNNEEERRTHILRKIELLKEKNQLLGEDPTSKPMDIVQEIAITEDISSRQAYKYNAVDSLIPELKEIFLRNKMSLNDGEFYSRLEPEEQEKIVELINLGNKGSGQELYELQQQLEKVNNEKEAEMEEYKKQLSELESKKKLAEGSLEILQKAAQKETEEAITRIKEELKREYDQLNEENTQEQVVKVESLESELENLSLVKKNLEENFQKEKKNSEIKEAEICELKKKITELEAGSKNKGNEEELVDKVKQEMTYRITYDNLTKSIKEFKNTASLCHIEKEDLLANIDSLINSLTSLKKQLTK